MLKYYPYKSDKPDKKYFIITKDNKKVYLGAAGMSDFTIHKDEERKQRYIYRHKKNEKQYWNKSGFLLWEKPTINESYQYIKNKYLKISNLLYI